MIFQETICASNVKTTQQQNTGYSNFNLTSANECNTTVLNALGLSGFNSP